MGWPMGERVVGRGRQPAGGMVTRWGSTQTGGASRGPPVELTERLPRCCARRPR